MRRENILSVYRKKRLTQGNPLQRQSTQRYLNAPFAHSCTIPRVWNMAALPLPGQTTVNEMSCIIESCGNTLPSSTFVCMKNLLSQNVKMEMVSKTARQQAVGKITAQKYSSYVKAIVQSKMNHLLRMFLLSLAHVIPNLYTFVLLTQKQTF